MSPCFTRAEQTTHGSERGGCKQCTWLCVMKQAGYSRLSLTVLLQGKASQCLSSKHAPKLTTCRSFMSRAGEGDITQSTS